MNVCFALRSVQVDRESSNHTEDVIVDIADPAAIVSVLVPELAAANSDTLSNILADDDLDQELISLVLLEELKFLLALVGNLFGPHGNFISIEIHILQLVLHDLFDSFFGFLGSEFVFELGPDLVGLLSLLFLFLLAAHLSYNALFLKL